MADVFISYSRRDGEFVSRLVEALKQKGLDVWMDKEDIPLSAEWWQEICSGIEGANNFTAIISPNFVKSDVCRQEVEYALQKNKRFVPILYSEIVEKDDKSALHPKLGGFSWVFFREIDDFDKALEDYISTLNADLDYIRAHTRLLVRAEEWKGKNRNAGFVLRGDDLKEAESWLVGGTSKEPSSTDLQREYIAASRSVATVRARIMLAVALVVLLAVSALAMVASNNIAIAQVENAQRESLRLAEASNQAVSVEGDIELAILLGIHAMRTSYTPQADAALMRAALQARTVQVFSGVTGKAVFSPDGRFVLTGGDNNTAVLWDAQTGNRVHTFSGHTAPVWNLVFSPDMNTVLTGSEDRTARLWDAESGDLIHTLLDHINTVDVAFSFDGGTIITYDGTVRLWNAETGELVRQSVDLSNGLLSPDGRFIATFVGEVRSDNNPTTIRLWDTKTDTLIREFGSPGYGVWGIAFSPDGHYLVTSNLYNTATDAVLYDVEGGTEIVTFHAGDTANLVSSAAFSLDGRYIVTGDQADTVQLREIGTDTVITEFAEYTSDINSVAFSPDGRYILASSGDGTARMWQIGLNTPVRIFSGESSNGVFSPDSQRILTLGGDLTVRIYKSENGELLHNISMSANNVYSVALSSDQQYILMRGNDGSTNLWNISTGSLVRTLDTSYVSDSVVTGAFSSDGRYLLTSGYVNPALGAETQMWETVSGNLVYTVSTGGNARDLTFSPDGRYFITNDYYGETELWDVGTRNLVCAFDTFSLHNTRYGLVDTAFSPNAEYVFLTHALDGAAWLFETKTCGLVRTISANNVDSGALFSSDGRYIVLDTYDGEVQFWQTETGELVYTLPHAGNLLAYSPDGHYVLTSNETETQLWEVNFQDRISFACSRVFRDLAETERIRFSITDDAPTCPQFVTNS